MLVPEAPTFPVSIDMSVAALKGFYVTDAFAQDTDEQKKEFRDDETKYMKYQKELESELSAGFALVYKDSEYQGQARALVEQMMRHSIGENKSLADILIPDFGLLCR